MSDQHSPPRDPASPSRDTGSPTTDTDAVSPDAGTPFADTGTSPTDTGASPTDSGASPTDPGASSTDAVFPETGTPAADTGASPTDAAISPTDTGASSSDTGAAPTDTGVEQSAEDSAETRATSTGPESPAPEAVAAPVASRAAATGTGASGSSGGGGGFLSWTSAVSGDLSIFWLPSLMLVVVAFMVAGVLGGGYGIPALFRDDCQLLTADGYGWPSIVNSPLFLAQVFAGLLSAILWAYVVIRGLTGPGVSTSLGASMGAFASRFLFFGLVFLGAGAYNLYLAREAALATSGFSDCYGVQEHLQAAAVRVAVGWAMGLAIGLIYGTFILTLHRLFGTAKKDEASVSVVGWLLWLLGIAVLAGLWIYPVLIPAASILVLLITILVIYTFIASLPRGLRFPAFVLLLGWIVYANQATDKYKFPGIERADGTSYYQADAVPAVDAGEATLVDPVAALQNWKDRWQAAQPAAAAADDTGEATAAEAAKPKLVLVATSGGAYRAAFWTGLVMDRLIAEEDAADSDLTGITDAVRLITGASGGMVGAAYYAANRTEDGVASVPSVTIGGVDFGPTVSSLWRDILEAQEQTPAAKASRMAGGSGAAAEETMSKECFQRETRYPIPGDSLSPVVQQLAQRDFFHLFIPRDFPCERGVILENQWLTLAPTYADWRTGEEQGWRPSLILSPMIVEKGQPLLISNLDLGGIRALPGGQEVMEFFNLFPGAEASFRIKTAVRMNATFPLISPAVMLPTEPRYRVVDAGYYDNNGIAVAVSFLSVPEVQDWLLENVSRVILIQLRAFPIGPDADPVERGQVSFDLPFSFLTSPVQGASTARKSAMVYRNEQELALVRSVLDERLSASQCADADDVAACRSSLADQDSFVETVVFENDTDVSLNWYLTEKELVSELYDVTQPAEGPAPADITAAEQERREQKEAFAAALDRLRTLWMQ